MIHEYNAIKKAAEHAKDKNSTAGKNYTWEDERPGANPIDEESWDGKSEKWIWCKT